MKSLIRKLVEIPGPPGYESRVREVVRSEIEPFVDALRVDGLGNLIARKGEVSAGGMRIMLAAPLDEAGLIAAHIDERGFVRFLPVGALRPEACTGGRARFLSGASGVIGMERPNKAPAFEQMFIDMGVARRQDCPIQVGEVAVLEQTFMELGNRLVSRALDNRIGVAVLIEALRQMEQQGKSSPYEISLVFSVQAQVGERGAAAAAFGVHPDLGLAINVTECTDTPKGLKNVSLGKGPAIRVRDQTMLSDPRLVQWMLETAEQAGLPYQLEIQEHSSSDARAMQFSRSGVPVGCLSIPCRYTHSPSEMVDYNDVQNAVRLLVALLGHPAQLAIA
ncbi:MAG: M20/M25/M40 family metallo-hydrolase [Anaerolineales bacterium]|nr:M20/M25/M40 family metallo-hydrolase [Anaerolineales bacterium]